MTSALSRMHISRSNFVILVKLDGLWICEGDHGSVVLCGLDVWMRKTNLSRESWVDFFRSFLPLALSTPYRLDPLARTILTLGNLSGSFKQAIRWPLFRASDFESRSFLSWASVGAERGAASSE